MRRVVVTGLGLLTPLGWGVEHNWKGIVEGRSGIGPITAGAIFDATGNYELFMMIGIPVFLVAGLLVAGLGPFPTFEPEPSEPATDGPARSLA